MSEALELFTKVLLPLIGLIEVLRFLFKRARLTVEEYQRLRQTVTQTASTAPLPSASDQTDSKRELG
jgi:hypothetical protein